MSFVWGMIHINICEQHLFDWTVRLRIYILFLMVRSNNTSTRLVVIFLKIRSNFMTNLSRIDHKYIQMSTYLFLQALTEIIVSLSNSWHM